jgi:hypothetical protein
METLAFTHFVPTTQKLTQIFSAQHETLDQKNAILKELSATVQEFDRQYLALSSEGNILRVQRAIIIGRVCEFVKDSLLHGEWTSWAADNFEEDIRTLQKFMAIARSGIALQYANLGTEKLYQLTRIEHHVTDQKGAPDIFTECGLDGNLEGYSSEKFEKAIIHILNRKALEAMEIDLSNEALGKLTENFSLIENNRTVLSRLAEAKSEEANFERAVENMVSTGAGKKTLRTEKGSKNLDVNQAAEIFIQAFQEALANPASSINEDRLRFIAKLVEEYFQNKR